MAEIPEEELVEETAKKNEYYIEPNKGTFGPQETKTFLIKIFVN